MRYASGKNQTAFIYESGTYANASGTAQWVGLVQSSEVDEELNIEQLRYVGQASQNIGIHVTGDEDYTGTLTFHPQDWKFLGFALGSITDTGSPSPYQHNLSEANHDAGNAFTSGTKNPPFSFTVEDVKQEATDGLHFKRTLNGCVVNSWELTGAQGDILECNVEYVAQDCTYASGTASAVTAATTRPLLFNMTQHQIPGGTNLDNVKEFSFSVQKNLNAPHYGNGSAVIDVPNLQERDYEYSLTLDQDSNNSKVLYDQYFRGGSEFNAVFTVKDGFAGAGSRDLTVTLSGCRIVDWEAPTPSEGTNEVSLTIVPTSCSAVADDLIQKYAPW